MDARYFVALVSESPWGVGVVNTWKGWPRRATGLKGRPPAGHTHQPVAAPLAERAGAAYLFACPRAAARCLAAARACPRYGEAARRLAEGGLRPVVSRAAFGSGSFAHLVGPRDAFACVVYSSDWVHPDFVVASRPPEVRYGWGEARKLPAHELTLAEPDYLETLGEHFFEFVAFAGV